MDLEAKIRRAETKKALLELNMKLPYSISFYSSDSVSGIRERLLKRNRALQTPSAIEIIYASAKKIQKLAKQANPPVEGKYKAELVSELLHRLITGGNISINECTEAEEALLTSPLEDYQEIGQKIQVKMYSSMDKCLTDFGQGDEIGRGSGGVVFKGIYGGKNVVFKLTDLRERGFDAFKWELTMLQRAGKAGVGAKLLAYQVCQVGQVQYGLAILAQCTPFDSARKFSSAEQKKIFALVEKLHHIGIVHNDLYIRNLVRSGSGFAIIDFDLAVCFDGPAPQEIAMIDYACLKEDGLISSFPSSLGSSLKTLADKLVNDYRLREELIINFFPDQMIQTLSYNEASLWLVYLHKGEYMPVKEEKRLENVFAARYGLTIKESFPKINQPPKIDSPDQDKKKIDLRRNVE